MSYRCRHPADEPAEPSIDDLEHILLEPGVDRILKGLENRHCRLILLSLKEGLVERKADLIVQLENDAETTELELIHKHLPKLAEMGYIEWDRTTDEISKGPRFEEIERFLELIENHSDTLPPNWPSP